MSQALVANNLPIPSTLGSMEAYIGAVHQIPVLSVEDEQRLQHQRQGQLSVEAGKLRLYPGGRWSGSPRWTGSRSSAWP